MYLILFWIIFWMYCRDCIAMCVVMPTPPPHSLAGCVVPETLSWLADCLAPPIAPPAAAKAPPTAACLCPSATEAEPPPLATVTGGGVACQCVGGVQQSVGWACPARQFECQRASGHGGRGHSDPPPPPAGPLLGNSTTAPPEWRTNGRRPGAGPEPGCRSNWPSPVSVAVSWRWAADPVPPGNGPPSTEQDKLSWSHLFVFIM